MKIKTLLLSALIAFSLNVFSQTLYVPSGTSGIGTSSTTDIGIGISNPSYKLHVVAPANSWKARFSGSDGYIDIGPANSTWAHIYTDRPKFLFNKPVYSIGGFSSYSTGNLYLQTGGTTRMTLKNTGNVGIGTTTPTADLEIFRSVRPQIILQNSFAKLSICVVNGVWEGAPTSKAGDVVFNQLGSQHGLIFNMNDDNNDGNSYVRFTSWSQDEIMGIYNNGKVRIDGKLFVKEVEVNSNVWADFVFKKDYKLKPLAELENYINENNHLPDLPTESEVLENGINLGKMDALLLQKIEELTLYVIEQGKEINALKQENQELKKATGLTK